MGTNRGIARAKLTVAVLAFMSAAYFHGGASTNQNARLDAAFNFVEPGLTQGTFQIDRFVVAPDLGINTMDWARVGSHYYANKAPLSIVLIAAAYAPLYNLERMLGIKHEAAATDIINSYLINVAVSATSFAATAALVFELFRAAGSPLMAAALSLVLCFGTALFPYSTQLWGHTTAATFILAALVTLRAATARAALWGGFWLAAALATDYMAGAAAFVIALTFLWQRPRQLPLMAAGASPMLALMLGYHWYCFGSPWTLATTHSNPVFTDSQRVLGMFGGPDLRALWQLTFSPYRGVFLQMPILGLALVGFVSWARRTQRDPWLWGCALTGLAGICAVASFNGWHGGSTVCARYLLPFLPVFFVAFAQVRWTRWNRAAAVVLGTLSVANMLAIAAVNPQCPETLLNPLYGHTYSELWAGHVAPYAYPVRLLQFHPAWQVLADWTNWNWGELFGLRGIRSLLPLLAAWACGALWLMRWQPRADLPAAAVPEISPGE